MTAPRVAFTAFLVAVVSWALGNRLGLIGFLLGAGASCLNLVGWWLLIRLMGSEPTEKAAKLGAGCSVFLFFLKLPLLIAAWYLAQKLGPETTAPFLMGLGLVYSWMLVWAQRPR